MAFYNLVFLFIRANSWSFNNLFVFLCEVEYTCFFWARVKSSLTKLILGIVARDSACIYIYIFFSGNLFAFAEFSLFYIINQVPSSY